MPAPSTTISEAERELLELWPAHLGKPRPIKVLHGFVSELVIQVAVDTGHGQRLYVAKLSRDFDRFVAASEARLMRTWASRGLAPAVLTSNGRLTVTEWIAGRRLQVEDLPRAAVLLGACHQTPSNGLPKLNELLVNRFGRLAVPGTTPTADAIVMSAAERSIRHTKPVEAVSLHADCHPGNLLVTEDRILVIDPLGASGDPSFDLAMLATTCDQHPYVSLATLRGAYPGNTETLSAWFAWCVAFRWRVESKQRPAYADNLWRILEKLAADQRWARLELGVRAVAPKPSEPPLT